MLENYINQISFGITALICIFLGAIFFKGGKGWVKTIQSGHKFSTKFKGFLWFFGGPIIVAVLASYLYQIILNFLTKNVVHLIWILLGFILIMWVYYCKIHKYKII